MNNLNGASFLSRQSIEQVQEQYLNKQSTRQTASLNEQGLSFEEVLEQAKAKDLNFSKHAATRLSDRNLELTPNQLERLSDGTKKAGAKGIKESLVLVDEMAFIVNTNSNTVITAFAQSESSENIITNIDGTVII